jgi:ribosomal protein L24E
METACSYCGSDVYKHSAVFVEEDSDEGREQAGRFCNYACLEAYIDENALTEGACCQIEL